ncbi:MAG: hypothetical protein A07HN63_02099, partial [uncultured archaeon A07HN63]
MTWHLDWQASGSLIGTILKYLSGTMLIPLVVAVIYGEAIWVFVASILLTLLVGVGLEQLDTDPDIGPTGGAVARLVGVARGAVVVRFRTC